MQASRWAPQAENTQAQAPATTSDSTPSAVTEDTFAQHVDPPAHEPAVVESDAMPAVRHFTARVSLFIVTYLE